MLAEKFKSLSLSDKDPEFYKSKADLRSTFPTAHMIELAEGMAMVVFEKQTFKVLI